MFEIVLVAAAVLIVVITGVLLKKEHSIDKDKKVKAQNKPVNFETKYEEITFLYKTGAIDEDEYKSQIKNYIN